jgi:hypothetical protein
MRANTKRNPEPRPDPISEDTRAVLRKENIYIVKGNGHRKYNKQVFQIQDCYNFLEYIFIVRVYIQKKYDIQWRTLEFLFFLYAKQFFTYQDFNRYPAPYDSKRIRRMIEIGYVKIFKERKGKSKQVYCLTTLGKRIVSLFYEHLSGERSIPATRSNNPILARKPKTKRVGQMQHMILELSKNSDVRYKVEVDGDDYYYGDTPDYPEEE